MRPLHAFSVCLLALLALIPAFARGQTLEALALTDARTEIVHVRRGETLTSLLIRTGASQADAQDAVSAIQHHWNPRELKVDEEITIDFGPRGLEAVQLEPNLDRIISAARRGDGRFASSAEPRTLTRIPRHAMGVIKTSLYEAAIDARVPLPLLSRDGPRLQL